MKTCKLVPDLFVAKVIDIPLDRLNAMQKKALIFDLDNTITEWNNLEIKEDIIQWFKLLRKRGFSACLLSNNKGPRVMEAADKLGIPFVAKATKPRRRAFRKALKVLGSNPKETVVIGDQIFTDVFGGNRMGLYTILVSPISTKEYIGTRFMRRIEHLVLKKMGIKHNA
ncbi:MAG: YqeG family HAD IIIA-type phosphatase [Bacillota bacterium]|jgi:HAD superfamily phosphatase (TIGR01668 family)|nr:YqeG family HAD IIIA-type phosphatase [Clostridia bacterium]